MRGILCKIRLCCFAVFLGISQFVMSQTRMDTLSVQVFFHQGKTFLDPQFRENGVRLQEFARSVEAFRKDNPEAFRSVHITSSASPEGASSLNQRLAKGRAESVYNYLRQYLEGIPCEVDAIENDWELLERLVVADPDVPNKDEVLEIIRNTPVWIKKNGVVVDGKKRQLMNLHGGRPWRYMYNRFFPDMRNSGASVSCVVELLEPKPEPVPEPEPEPIPEPIPEPEPVPEPIPEPEPEPEVTVLERRHVLAVRSNLLYDGFYMPNFGWAPSPNIQLEYYPKDGHFTYNLGFTSPYYHRWNKHKFFQIRDYNIQARYYFKGHGDFTGWYASAYVHNNKYGIGFSKTKGWEGEGLGGGLTGGYVLPLSKRYPRWRLEFSLGVGYYQTKYDPYVYGNPITGQEDTKYYYNYTGDTKNFKERNHRFTWLGPSEVGVHLTYDLLFKCIQKKGISFNRKEERK